MKRRTFLGVLASAVPALLLCAHSTSVTPKTTAKYAVYRTGSGVEFVRVPWSKDGRAEGQRNEAKILRPKDEPFSQRGYFVETEDGLREIASNEQATSLLKRGIESIVGWDETHDRTVLDELVKVWNLA